MTEQTQAAHLQDGVIALGDFDDNMAFRHAGLCSCLFLFNDALDPAKLKSTLSKLVEMPGWRKLGARLQLNVLTLPIVWR